MRLIHKQPIHTHTLLPAFEPCTVLDFALVRDDALSLPLCAGLGPPCTCAGPCVLALPLRYLWTCIFAYALGRAASHTNTPALANQLSVLAASHFLSSRVWWTPSTLTPLPLTSCANRLSLPRLFAALSLLGPSRCSRILRLSLPFLSRLRLSRLVPTVSILHDPPRLFASLLVPSRALSCLFASLLVCPLVRSLANALDPSLTSLASASSPLTPCARSYQRSLSILRLSPPFLSRLVSHVSCQPSRSFMTPLASSPRSLCPLVRSVGHLPVLPSPG